MRKKPKLLSFSLKIHWVRSIIFFWKIKTLFDEFTTKYFEFYEILKKFYEILLFRWIFRSILCKHKFIFRTILEYNHSFIIVMNFKSNPQTHFFRIISLDWISIVKLVKNPVYFRRVVNLCRPWDNFLVITTAFQCFFCENHYDSKDLKNAINYLQCAKKN